MNATTILLARHGETSLSREDYFCGSTDVPLSEAGQAQAEALARALRAVPLAAVYCSPLQRARDTAAPTASWHNLEPTVLADLREMDFGAWEGRARAEILDMDGATYERWARNQTAHTPAGSEHPYAVAGRAVPALMRIPMCYDGLGQIALGNPLQTRAVEGPNDEYQAHRPPSEPSRAPFHGDPATAGHLYRRPKARHPCRVRVLCPR